MLLALRSRRFATVLVCLLTLTATQAAHASIGLTFQGLVRTINTGGGITLSSPSGMVVDSAGNIYIADTGHGQIVEVNAQGTTSVLTISGLSPALVSPAGIAIDGSGNLYVTDADPANSRVVKISSSGAGSVINTGSVTLSSPKGVALDQSGDIFIADTGNNRVVEVTAGGSAAALSITGLSRPNTLNTPMGLAVEVFGNLYIADSVNSRIVKMAAGSTAGAVVSIAGGVTLNTPSGLAVDRIGNIFIADTGNNRIAEVDTAGNGTVLFTPSMTLSGPWELQ